MTNNQAALQIKAEALNVYSTRENREQVSFLHLSVRNANSLASAHVLPIVQK
jgi:hypothetical protein